MKSIDVQRAWTATSMFVMIRTKAFIHPPNSRSPAGIRGLCSPASSARLALCTRFGRRPRSPAGGWSGARYGREYRSTLQSVEGVLLPPAERVEEYAPFLSEAIRIHLNDEWMEQECHGSIGDEVARLFRETLAQGTTDMSSLVLDVGTGLESFDMEDAFVGPWDIANLVSDFLMDKMGAETSTCNVRAPPTSMDQGSREITTSTFHLTMEGVQQMNEVLVTDFSRYRFLGNFMNDEIDWSVVNTIVALYQGYTPEDADAPEMNEPIREVWRRTFPGPLPPDVSTANGVVEALERDFPDDPDLVDGLEVIVETLYGGYAKKLDSGDPDKGIAPNEGYVRRSTICKWMYIMGILQDDVKRAPEDPEILVDMITGRKRLGA